MSTNDITGDVIKTKPSTDAFRDGWDKIFGDKLDLAEPEDPDLPHFLKPQAS